MNEYIYLKYGKYKSFNCVHNIYVFFECETLHFKSFEFIMWLPEILSSYLQVFLCITISQLHIYLLPYINDMYISMSGCAQAFVAFVSYVHLSCYKK